MVLLRQALLERDKLKNEDARGAMPWKRRKEIRNLISVQDTRIEDLTVEILKTGISQEDLHTEIFK